MDTKQSHTNLGLSFGEVNCLAVFQAHVNPNIPFEYYRSNLK